MPLEEIFGKQIFEQEHVKEMLRNMLRRARRRIDERGGPADPKTYVQVYVKGGFANKEHQAAAMAAYAASASKAAASKPASAMKGANAKSKTPAAAKGAAKMVSAEQAKTPGGTRSSVASSKSSPGKSSPGTGSPGSDRASPGMPGERSPTELSVVRPCPRPAPRKPLPPSKKVPRPTSPSHGSSAQRLPGKDSPPGKGSPPATASGNKRSPPRPTISPPRHVRDVDIAECDTALPPGSKRSVPPSTRSGTSSASSKAGVRRANTAGRTFANGKSHRQKGSPPGGTYSSGPGHAACLGPQEQDTERAVESGFSHVRPVPPRTMPSVHAYGGVRSAEAGGCLKHAEGPSHHHLAMTTQHLGSRSKSPDHWLEPGAFRPSWGDNRPLPERTPPPFPKQERRGESLAREVVLAGENNRQQYAGHR